MSKYCVLAAHNMRKYRGQYISFSLIVLLAAILLNIGLVTVLNNQKNYSAKFDQYNCAEVFLTLNDTSLSEEFADTAQELEGVKKVETRESIMMSGEASYGHGGNTLGHIFFNMDEKHTLNQLVPIGETLDLESTEQPAYVSYWIKTSGCKLGDVYEFESNGKTYRFTIAGFVEDMMYGNNNCGNLAVYLPQKEFEALYQEITDAAKAFTISLAIEDRAASKDIFTKFFDGVSGKIMQRGETSYGYYERHMRNRTLTASITASIIVVFAILLTAVTMILINFRIKSSIQEEMQNMGILKSIGYSANQVIMSISFPYLLLAGFTVVAGIVLSYLVLPNVNSVFESLMGLRWGQGFDLKACTIVILVMISLVLLTTLLSARMIKRLHPIVALRSGIKHHSFKTNHFPLQKLNCNIHLGLALKNFSYHYKQNIFLAFLLFLMTFVAIFAGSGMYNTVAENDIFIKAFSEEYPSVSITANSHEAAEDMRSRLSGDERVQKTLYYDKNSVTIEDENINLLIVDEYDRLDNNICYAGRNPLHDNEIVIGNSITERRGLNIGDEITVTYQEVSYSYLIVGFIQAMDYGGDACEMTSAGFARINKDFKPSTLFIYLRDDIKSDAFIKEIVKAEGDLIGSYMDYEKLLDQVFGNFATLTSMMVSIISIVVLLIIIVALYMIIKTVVLHRRQELGILKAVGYSSRQLILQQAYSMLPSIVFGIGAGGITGQLLINRVWLLCFYPIGVRKTDLQIPILWTLIIGIALASLSFLISVLMSGKIRKVHAIELIRE